MNQAERRATMITRGATEALDDLSSLRYHITKLHSLLMVVMDDETINALNHLETLLRTFN